MLPQISVPFIDFLYIVVVLYVYKNNLSNTASSQNKRYEKLETIKQQTLNLQKILRTEYFDMLTSMNNLASILNSQMKFETAEMIEQRTPQVRNSFFKKQVLRIFNARPSNSGTNSQPAMCKLRWSLCETSTRRRANAITIFCLKWLIDAVHYHFLLRLYEISINSTAIWHSP